MDSSEFGFGEGTIYRAGQRAPAGQYVRIDRPEVTVTLTQTDHLPPSFDGTVAHYARIVRVADLVRG